MAQHILVVDDDPSAREGLARLLQRLSYRTTQASGGAEALSLVEQDVFDLVLSDLQMPGMDGLELLRQLREKAPGLSTVLVSGAGTIDAAVKAVQLGALDFLEKPPSLERLTVTVANALRFVRLRDAQAAGENTDALERLVGESPAMQRLRELVARIAATDGRVLVLGENGSGKELVAVAIHAGSARRDGPFVKLNCAAMPEGLVESELFGHEKGAFTGASGARKGRFELADGGTLFLDEIGELPLAVQAKLLRVLQEARFERVGGSRTLQADVRVVAATNRDLEEMIDAGTFREDLYYRLNVVTLRVPALRERPGDVPLLARHFVRLAGTRHGRPRLSLTDAALQALAAHDYRGNVRELQNVVERLAILAETETLDVADVRDALPSRRRERGNPGPYRPGTPLRDLLGEAEKAIVKASIAANGGSKSAAAKELDLERSHFYKKCKQLGID